MTISLFEFGYVSICQLAHCIGQRRQAEHSLPYDHTESCVKFMEKVV